jgi:hypothetical protein
MCRLRISSYAYWEGIGFVGGGQQLEIGVRDT